MWPGFDSQCHMWVEIVVVGSHLCSKRFTSGCPVLSSPQRPGKSPNWCFVLNTLTVK